MDELKGYYAKWNKSERQIQYDFTYIWNLKNNINQTEADWQIQRTNWWLPNGREIGELDEKGTQIKEYKLVVTTNTYSTA